MRWEKVESISPIRKKFSLGLKLSGMALLTLGFAQLGFILFAVGLIWMENGWREEYGFKESWFDGVAWAERLEFSKQFYAETHQNETNKLLHRVGIPMILGGAFLLLATPLFNATWGSLWSIGFTLWVIGWGLNLYGHKVHEGRSPALTEDPLGTLAGPIMDFSGALKAAPSSKTELIERDDLGHPMRRHDDIPIKLDLKRQENLSSTNLDPTVEGYPIAPTVNEQPNIKVES